jgi:anaerobic magnesium-protoporphyrin IX monomethyl ester cyclase
MKILLVYPNIPLTGEMPYNLAILSAFLKREGFDVKLFDGSTITPNPNYKKVLGGDEKSEIFKPIIGDWNIEFNKLVNDFKPNIIGLSLVSGTISMGMDLIKSLENKNIPIITGGVGSTVEYEKILKTGLVDYVCIGEGEEAFTELCLKLSKGEDVTNIKNIYSIKDGEIKKNSLRPLIDINTLPTPDFSIYEYWRFYRMYNNVMYRTGIIEFDRGCPYNCTYCSAPMLRKIMKSENNGSYFRIKNNDVIIKELKELKETYDLNHFYFTSETFLAIEKEKLKELSKRYKEEINLPFWCQTRFDTITDETAKILSEMGCTVVNVGLEHGSESIRNEMLGKKITNKQVLKAFELLGKYNLHTNINILVGVPGDTRETIFETIEICKKAASLLNHNYGIRTFVFMPFPGTKLRDVCLERKYINIEDEIPSIFRKTSLLNMPTISKDEIYKFKYLIPLYVGLSKEKWGELEELEKNNLTDKYKMKELMLIVEKIKKGIY